MTVGIVAPCRRRHRPVRTGRIDPTPGPCASLSSAPATGSFGCPSARSYTLSRSQLGRRNDLAPCISEPRGLSDRVFVPTSRLKEAVMYAVVRSYSGQGVSELLDQLEQ